MVLVQTGVEYETKSENGIAHFIEHLVFKGTTKRPKSFDIASELDGLGAEYNAFTSREYTAYYAKVRSEAWKKVFAVISDIYVNPLFDREEIEREKGVVIEEMNMYEDQPSDKAQDLLTECMYGDTPKGWKILGTKETVSSLNREKILAYYKEHYVPERTIVVVSGNCEKEKILPIIESTMGHVNKNGGKWEKIPSSGKEEKKEIILEKSIDQTHLAIGYKAYDAHHKNRFALSVLGNVLGGTMSSRLFQKVREELGGAYYVHSGASLHSDHGSFVIASGLDKTKVEIVLEAIRNEIIKCKEVLVSEPELTRAKENLIGTLFLSLETSDEIGHFYGRAETLGLPLNDPSWIKEQIQKVTAEEIRSVAREIFTSENTHLSVVGPVPKESLIGLLQM